ncbi:hypothetical protein D9M68_753040 [compost metagenome]
MYPEGFVDRIGKLQHLRVFEGLIILSEVENTHSVYFLREQFFYVLYRKKQGQRTGVWPERHTQSGGLAFKRKQKSLVLNRHPGLYTQCIYSCATARELHTIPLVSVRYVVTY